MLSEPQKAITSENIANGLSPLVSAAPSIEFVDAGEGRTDVTVTVTARFGEVAAVVAYDDALLEKALTDAGAANFVRENTLAAVVRAVVSASF